MGTAPYDTPSIETAGEAFRLPRDGKPVPYGAPKDYSAETIMRRSFDYALRASLRMIGVVGDYQLSTSIIALIRPRFAQPPSPGGRL